MPRTSNLSDCRNTRMACWSLVPGPRASWSTMILIFWAAAVVPRRATSRHIIFEKHRSMSPPTVLFSLCPGNQGACHFLDVGHFVRRGSFHVVAYQLFAAIAHLIVGCGVLATNRQQFFEPVLAVTGVHGFVGPVEVHVVLTRGVTVSAEKLGAGRLVADVLGFEEIEHPQAIDRIFAGSTFVNVGSQRNVCGIKTPSHQAFVAHPAVARFIVGPARSIVYPFPGQNVSERAQHHATVFYGPDFVQVTDRRSKLQLHAFAVGTSGVDYVRPVKAARPEAQVPRGFVGNEVGLSAWQWPYGS